MKTMADKPYTEEDAEAERAHLLRSDGDRVTRWTRPNLEPLTTRLSLTAEIDACRHMTFQMLEELHASQPCHIAANVRVGRSVSTPEGYGVKSLPIAADFLVVSWTGAFLVWSWPDRYCADTIPTATRARAQIQKDLGEEWPGRVEAVFHFPREHPTGWVRNVGVDEGSDDPFDIVMAAGRLDEVLTQWEPHAGAGIDPEWLRWLSQASEPRWWELATIRAVPPAPEVPTDE
jgi:hypothetical protein